MKHRTSVVLVVALVFLSVVTASAQSPNTVADLLARVNRERVARGRAPYALNAQLSAAAQAHATDIARTGKLGHTGSDGSTVFDRVARTGYGAYSWGRRLGENWVWAKDIDSGMERWMGSKPHRDNILHAVYREIGIGIAPYREGGFLFVLNFGVQPNVLPIFINDGASETRSRTVTLWLNDEEVYDNSGGNIQRVKQIQVSNTANFAGAEWQEFSEKITWTLTSGSGTKTVYVKFRDARGRTVTSSDSIVLNEGDTSSQPRVAAPPTTPAATPRRTNTPRPTATRTRSATMVVPTPSPIAQDTPTATPTSSPTVDADVAVPVISQAIPTPTVFVTAPEQATPAHTATRATTESSDLSERQPNTGSADLVETRAISSKPLLVVSSSNPSTDSGDTRRATGLEQIALGVLGMAIVLGLLASYKFLSSREP